MTYEQMLARLYHLKGTGLDLPKALAQIGNPEKKLKCIRVGGTNGKGSTCAFLSHILQEAGYRVGLFTSPHLIDPEERLQINGQKISRVDFQGYFERAWQTITKLHGTQAESVARFFEVLVIMALDYFAHERVDLAIIEAGVGGRRDDTNIIRPLFSILTNVDLDHQEVLGETIEAIAEEKTGIAPPGVALLAAETKHEALRVMERVCRTQRSPLFQVNFQSLREKASDWDGQCFDWNTLKNLGITMLGSHQVKNAVTALSAVELLKTQGFTIEEQALRLGLKETRWPGRMELLQKQPYVLLDGAKNPSGLCSLRKSIGTLPYASLIVILGISTRKDIAEMVAEIVPVADHIIVTQASFRGNDPAFIAAEVRRLGCPCENTLNCQQALERALSLAKTHDLICCTGSLFLAGEVRRLWLSRKFAKVEEIG